MPTMMLSVFQPKSERRIHRKRTMAIPQIPDWYAWNLARSFERARNE